MDKILIVEDELGAREALKETFYGLYEVIAVENALEGLSHLSRQRADIILMDLVMPRVSGISFLKEVRQLYPDLPVLVVTASSSDELTKEALSLGAVGLVRKPWDVHELRNLVRQSIAATEASRQHELLSKEVSKDFPAIAPIGQSAVFRRMLENARAVADNHVLLTGESGVGKEFVARQIHTWSRRTAEPFVHVSCRELPAAFLEAEIFGQWSGASDQTRRGAIDLARNSSLLIQDVDCLPSAVQERLVQLMTRREYQRVGSTQVIPSSARIFATLEMPVSEAVTSDRIIRALAEAFSPRVITVPPLRERRDDIPLLAHHFLHQYRQSLNAETLDIAPGAMQKLRDYHWPGNVRELRNVIERMLVLYGGSKQIAASELPQELMRSDTSDRSEIDYDASVSAYERSLIETAFERSNGTIAAAARILGISARQLQTRVDKLKIRRSPYKREG
jgi:two-component system response regulator AtoC